MGMSKNPTFPFPSSLFPFPFPSKYQTLFPFPWASHGPMGSHLFPFPCTPLLPTPTLMRHQNWHSSNLQRSTIGYLGNSWAICFFISVIQISVVLMAAAALFWTSEVVVGLLYVRIFPVFHSKTAWWRTQNKNTEFNKHTCSLNG